jgi:LPS-assembly protein
MAVRRQKVCSRRTGAFRFGGVLALCVISVLAGSLPAGAQEAQSPLFREVPEAPPSQMLLEADQVVYDTNTSTISAVGNVRIAYNRYTLVAQRVTYSRTTGRVIANGNVEIAEPDGTRVFAEEIDITDDFSDGFVSSLQVETADNTHFAAQSAERRDGAVSIFHNGVYTACEPCKDDPSKPPLWQIRANRVIIDKTTRTVQYEGASFELYGKPIAYLPRFSHADPAIRRKSGFLVPILSYSDTQGIGLKESYFLALAPNYDLTLNGTYFTNQGFLGEAEWRHRLANGQYNLRVAGINQHNPSDFGKSTIDGSNNERTAIMSSGRFEINPRWKFGWNALFQSDEDFARTYNLAGFDGRDVTNEVYLTGLAGKNYFDLRALKFLIQDDRIDQDPHQSGNQKLQEQQGNALPILDYSRVSSDPVYGGQASLDVNVQNIYRHKADAVNLNTPSTLDDRYPGIPGNSSRGSMALEWKRSEITNGAVITGLIAARGDAILLNTDDPDSTYNPLPDNGNLWRGMATGMLEIRYPLIAHDGFATHLFEPIAQIIARPDETHIGEIPNEDAQSLVFDTTNLFERDKFSGYDRVEGGVRTNLGFRYSASYNNGSTLNVAAGQSIHLAGKNSFEQRGLVNAGIESGLDTDLSDYVVSANVDNGHGFAVGAGGRFDQSDLDFRRGVLNAAYSQPGFAVAGNYVFIDSQPEYAYAERRQEANALASVQLSEYWRAFGSLSYDIEQNNVYSRGIGLAYDDSCFSFSASYNESEDRYTGAANGTSFLFRIGLRTIGDYNYKYSEDAQ